MTGNLTDNGTRFVGDLGATLKSLVKIACCKKNTMNLLCNEGASHQGIPLIILGNGPSLRNNIEHDMPRLQSHPSLAVNFAANAPEFRLLQPCYYLLADPHFFNNTSDPNVSNLINNLSNVGWPMKLLVPSAAKVPHALQANKRLQIATFPFNAVEGFKRFENLAFSHVLGMPRPRNVLIPSIMAGAWMGYKTIYILGADHSWLKTLSVTNDNRVVSIQPHFYTEDKHEEQRIRQDYVNLRLHEVLESMQIAFKSYHIINRWARKNGICIYNATPGSMIDAFERKQLS